LAVAASAAYPALLPASDLKFTFIDRNGNEQAHRVILTDGGAYDNLGLSCLEPERSPEFSMNVFSPDYLICCAAGTGQFENDIYPYFWPARMKRAFETTFRRTLTESYERLHDWRESGKIKGFVLTYLGQQDSQLPRIPLDLVRRDEVMSYPTDFSAMSSSDIEKLSARGGQLTRILISKYIPEI
jgi:NTE family protein